MAQPVPVFLSALSGMSADWRQDFAWPEEFHRIAGVLAEIQRRSLDVVAGIGDEDACRIALLARPPATVLALAQFAVWIEAAARKGQRLVGHPVLDFLCHDPSIGDREALDMAAATLAGRPPRALWLRRLVRVASWTPPHRLPGALWSPDALAMNHNSLLRDGLRRRGGRVRYAYDSDFDLGGSGGAVSGGPTPDLDLPRIGRLLADAATACLDIRSEIAGRFRRLAELVILDALQRGAETLRHLRHVTLPRLLYTGTGSKWMPRAAGLEVLRRGGEVIRFDHGGSAILLEQPGVALSEFAVSTRFVVPTPPAAQSSNLVSAARLVEPIRRCRLEGGAGDPGLDVGRAALSRRPTAARARPRVLYVTSVFYEWIRQLSPPLMPPVLYLDWQLHLVSLLAAMPVALFHKPHPEGPRPPAGSAPEAWGTTLDSPFSRAVRDADVLVYDYFATTTLAEGLCTDRPIVLIDLGAAGFADSLSGEIRRRCRVVGVTYDAACRPRVDQAALRDAVCADHGPVDPTFFRRLFLGEGL